MLFLLIDLCATITLLAGIEPDHWFGLKLKKVAGSILKIGAIDGTRTHLIRIDNPLPSPRTTMACLVENTGIEPVVPEDGGFTIHCITIDASSPLLVTHSEESNSASKHYLESHTGYDPV